MKTALRLPCVSLAMATLPAVASAAPATIVAASHRGDIRANSIEWRSVIVGFRSGQEPHRVVLAMPLPAKVAIDEEASGAATVRDRSGRIIGFDVPNDSWTRRWHGNHARPASITLVVRQPIEDPAESLTLAAPLVAGQVVQRLVVRGAGGLRFVPDERSGIVPHIGFMASIATDRESRRQCDRFLDADDGTTGAGRLYVVAGPALLGAGGLLGRLEGGRAPGRFVAICMIAVLGSAILALVHRRMSRKAQLEHAEAVLEAEYDALNTR